MVVCVFPTLQLWRSAVSASNAEDDSFNERKASQTQTMAEQYRMRMGPGPWSNLLVCVCVSGYLRLYICIYIYDYTCMYIYIYTHTCIQKNTSSGFVWTSRGKITWSASGFGAPWRLKRPWVRSHVIRWQHSPRLGGRSKTCGFSGWNGALLAMVINQHNST